MVYKVGDKVIPINKEDGNSDIIGKVGTITEVYDTWAEVKFNEDINGWGEGSKRWNIIFDNLRLAFYSWEDFKKCPIGTKVYFENGVILIKYSDNEFGNEERHREYFELEDFKDNVEVIGKITKIEEPVDYVTRYIKSEFEVKEMTIKEISDILGYDVKIIKEEDK